MQRGNCWLWARWEYRRRVREWRAAGMPPGLEPYWIERPSRSRPRCIEHRLIGRYDSEHDMLAMESFAPVAPTDAPWWLAWTHLLFRGRVKAGDFPHTLPVRSSLEDHYP